MSYYHRALIVPFVLLGCAATERRHHRATAAEAPAAASRETTVESRRGANHQSTITCGQHHRYTLVMGANETVRATFRTSMTGAQPLGEDIAWRWHSPSNGVLDTNALPIPETNQPPREASFEVRSTYAGRYALAIVVEEGAACAHASYTLEIR